MAEVKLKDLPLADGVIYYIAYGSNLSREQMAYRCPTAELVGTGVLKGYKLMFKLYATIEPQPGKEVPVLIWKLQPSDEESLDSYEGFPEYYYKKYLSLPVNCFKDRQVRRLAAMVYIMADQYKREAPSTEYYKVLENGYDDFGFDKKILEDALAECQIDTAW